jgi:citrate synthase
MTSNVWWVSRDHQRQTPAGTDHRNHRDPDVRLSVFNPVAQRLQKAPHREDVKLAEIEAMIVEKMLGVMEQKTRLRTGDATQTSCSGLPSIGS